MRWANSNGVSKSARPVTHSIQRFILQYMSSIGRMFTLNNLAIPSQTATIDVQSFMAMPRQVGR